MNKNIILFDLDGTVIDSKLGIFNSIDYLFHKLNMPIPDESVKRRFIGPSIGASLRGIFGFSEKEAEDGVAIYREYYSTTGIMEFELYAGIAEHIRDLKVCGKTVGMATKKPEMFATRIIESVKLPFDLVCGSEPNDHDESKAHIIKRASVALSKDANFNDVVMIGDSQYDIVGSNEVGVDSIGVMYGYGTREEFVENNATWICDSVADLSKLLLK